MTNKELLQYGFSILVALGLLGYLAKEARAEDKRLDTLCGDDRSGCVTEVTTSIGAVGGAWGGMLVSHENVEYIQMTPTPIATP